VYSGYFVNKWPEVDENMIWRFQRQNVRKWDGAKAIGVVIQLIPESELRKKGKRSRKCVISMGDERPSWDSVEQWNGAMSNDAADDS
jgi:hypothetical protein